VCFSTVQARSGDCDAMITARKVIRSLTAAMPAWLIAICGLCLIFPLARLAALLFTATLCLIQPARVRRAASAWKGGKSHRASNESSELHRPQPDLAIGRQA
jgi:hypothetical protein